jgi:hypothetical protein
VGGVEGLGSLVEEAKEMVGTLCPRTKTYPLNKGRGAKVVDFLMVYGGLIEIKLQYGLGYNLCGKVPCIG